MFCVSVSQELEQCCNSIGSSAFCGVTTCVAFIGLHTGFKAGSSAVHILHTSSNRVHVPISWINTIVDYVGIHISVNFSVKFQHFQLSNR